MLSLQNAKWSRNGVLAVRCVVILLLCGALLMMSAISTTNVRAQGQSAAGKFRRVGRPIPNQYIVVLNDDIPGSEVASRAGEMARTIGGSIGHIYRYALRGFSARMSEAAARALSLDPRVEFVEEDGTASVAVAPPWGHDRIDQPNLPLDLSYTYNETGMGVNAYVIDTGVRTSHNDFGGRASLGADCTVRDGNGNCIGNGTDVVGHGTQVASIVGANTYGVAKSVTIYNVRVCGDNAACVHSDWIAGIDWVTNAHTNTHTGPAVANQSLGTTQDGGPSSAIDKAVRRSIAGGVTHVVCAQNDNVNLDLFPVSPARVTQAITVGATGNHQPNDPNADPVSDQRASFSNFGSVLDLFAPGVRIPSASPSDDNLAVDFGGTSASSPHVAGAVARYLQTDPTACPSTVSEVITSVATSGVVTDPGAGSPNKLLFTPLSWPAPTYYSLSLNGTSAYVDVPNAGLGVSLDFTGPVTVEAWVKLNSNTVRQAIVEKYNPSAGAGTNNGGYGLRLMPSGKVRFFTFKNAVEYSFITSSTVLSTGTWYHVAGVFDGTQLKIYVQGMSDATPVSATYPPQAGTSNLKIGVSPEGTYFLNGLIDEARVTARAIYTANFTAQHKLTGVLDTKGLWRFDRRNAKDCADIHNGSLVGEASFSTTVP
ncbi:MAG: S8 family serine peptidase [Acidobacteriota bacterium]